ncbi:MAG: hypothetical protein V4490_00795 [Pseudomonadota bacterium]
MFQRAQRPAAVTIEELRLLTWEELSAKYITSPMDFRALADRQEEFHHDVMATITETVRTSGAGVARANFAALFTLPLIATLSQLDAANSNISSYGSVFVEDPNSLSDKMKRAFTDDCNLKLNEYFKILTKYVIYFSADPEFAQRFQVPRLEIKRHRSSYEFTDPTAVALRLEGMLLLANKLRDVSSQLDRLLSAAPPASEEIIAWWYRCCEFQYEFSSEMSWLSGCDHGQFSPPEFSDRVTEAKLFAHKVEIFLCKFGSIEPNISIEKLNQCRDELSELVSKIPNREDCKWLEVPSEENVVHVVCARARNFAPLVEFKRRQQAASFSTSESKKPEAQLPKQVLSVSEAHKVEPAIDSTFHKKQIRFMKSKKISFGKKMLSVISGVVFFLIVAAFVALASIKVALIIAASCIALGSISAISLWINREKTDVTLKSDMQAPISERDVETDFSAKPSNTVQVSLAPPSKNAECTSKVAVKVPVGTSAVEAGFSSKLGSPARVSPVLSSKKVECTAKARMQSPVGASAVEAGVSPTLGNSVQVSPPLPSPNGGQDVATVRANLMGALDRARPDATSCATQ